MTLLELAERCEAATGPDAALDREIWLKAVADKEQRFLVEVGRDAHGDKEANFRTDWMADGARYTASIDAALTLVPEGSSWMLIRHSEGFTLAKAGSDPCKGATPALALCAASLRARGNPEEKPNDV